MQSTHIPLTPELLAGHIIRFDNIPETYDKPDAIKSHVEKLYHNAHFTVSSSGSFMSINMDDSFARQDHRFNLDFIVGSYHGEASTHLNKTLDDVFHSNKLNNRSDVFERDEQNNWRRISVRLSCIRLAADYRKTGTLTCSRDIFADDQF